MTKPISALNRHGRHIFRAFLILAVIIVAVVIAVAELDGFRGLSAGDIGFYPAQNTSPAR